MVVSVLERFGYPGLIKAYCRIFEYFEELNEPLTTFIDLCHIIGAGCMPVPYVTKIELYALDLFFSELIISFIP
jgi:hypothetical protein